MAYSNSNPPPAWKSPSDPDVLASLPPSEVSSRDIAKRMDSLEKEVYREVKNKAVDFVRDRARGTSWHLPALLAAPMAVDFFMQQLGKSINNRYLRTLSDGGNDQPPKSPPTVSRPFKDRDDGPSGNGSDSPSSGSPINFNPRGKDMSRKRRRNSENIDRGTSSGKNQENVAKGVVRANRAQLTTQSLKYEQAPNAKGAGTEKEGTNLAQYKTGLMSGLILNPFAGSSKTSAPFFAANGYAFPLNSTHVEGSILSQELALNVYPAINRIIQSSVRPGASPKIMEDAEINAYFEQVIKGLSIYLTYDSLITIHSNDRNYNQGVSGMVNHLGPTSAALLANLKMALQRYCLPPAIVKFLTYWYQCFTAYPDPTSPIFKFSYGNLLSHDGMDDWASMQDVIDITNILNGQTASSVEQLRQWNDRFNHAFPEWRINVPNSSTVPLYDPQMSTVWHNQDIIYKQWISATDDRTVHTRLVGDKADENIYYGLLEAEIDGAFYAMTSIGTDIESDLLIQPGTWLPYNDWGHTTVSTGDRVSVQYWNDHDHLPGEMKAISDGGHGVASNIYKVPNFSGTIWSETTGGRMQFRRCQVHSVNNLKYAVVQFARHLFYPGGEA